MGKALIKSIIVLVIIFSISYLISYNKWKDNHFDDIDVTYKEEKSDDEKEIISKKEYKELYNKVNFELIQRNFGQEFYDYYYKNKEFNDEFYIFVAVVNMIQNETLTNCNIERKIIGIEVQNKIYEIFGSVSYSPKSFTTADNNLVITYNDVDDEYLIKTNKCSDFDYTKGGIKTEYDKSSIIGESLYVYEKALYLDYSFDSNNNLIFNYHSGLDKDSKIIANNYESIDFNKVPTYVYRFEKKNNNYYFVEVEEK